MWTESFKKRLQETLPPSSAALMMAFIEVAQSTEDTNVATASKQAVLNALAAKEGRELEADALRQRVQTIRNTLKSEPALQIEGAAPFSLQLTKHSMTLTWSEGAQNWLKRQRTRAAVTRSGQADMQTSIGDAEHVTGEFELPLHYVFLSHNWEAEQFNKKLDAFYALLKDSLSKLPSRWVHQFEVKIIYDRGDGFHSKAFTSDQIDELCEKASFAIFMTSAGWCKSPACQQEKGHFFSRPEVGSQKPYLCIQLLGDRNDLGPDYTDWLIWPSKEPKTCKNAKNLLELMNKSAATQSDFVSAIRDEICDFLEKLGGPPRPAPPEKPPRRTRSVYEILLEQGQKFEADIPQGHRLEGEFSREDGDDHAA